MTKAADDDARARDTIQLWHVAIDFSVGELAALTCMEAPGPMECSMQVDLIHTLIAVSFFTVVALIGQIIRRSKQSQAPSHVFY